MVKSCYGLDPGTRCSGLALVVEGEVKFVAAIKAEPKEGWEMPALLVATVLDLRPCERFVVENQQAYGRGKADPNDLIRLSHAAGAAAGAAALRAQEVFFPLPRTWKKGVPKGAHHDRLLKGLGWEYEFDGPKRPAKNVKIPETVAVLGEIDNSNISEVLDAIGLALWGLKQ